ncbi:pyridoxal phosphate-dependent aminotransferase [Ahrensia sp. R2A130]|uniref:pyridoxal phosphate-dependent aminotransferase n=1 Tax=Ahrensia sp. R2A130 TaxID=744979 RepID=UPI0001E0B4BB|nr:pyridoxal phosphate-dependent aminotransferase [Ahrensia sp. R2A130]EFL89752.1 aminotransferase class I and II [Ahrensia sp. R2A130]
MTLKTASITDRLANLGAARWDVHFEGRKRLAAGENLIELTIGEPDIPTPPALIEVAAQSMRDGRTGYAAGRGEPGMVAAIAAKYSARTGRTIDPRQVLSFPGTQAALSLCMLSLTEAGDDVLLPDPYYATYESVVRASGAQFVPVPMEAANGFHLTPDQLEAAITSSSKVLLLNSPHNPTGATLSAPEIGAIGEVCEAHDLWILSDEVYEPLVYSGTFASPFDDARLAERTVVVSSLSKSHAAPGFRAGWSVSPLWFADKAQSVSEAVLFGNQPFIADMVEAALKSDDDPAAEMGANYRSRIEAVKACFDGTPLKPMVPEAGMFMLVDVSASGMDGEAFARKALDHGVSVMPGGSFGSQAKAFIRLSLTVPEDDLREAAERLVGVL